MAIQPHPLSTLEEYLSRERNADFRSEYYAGEVYAMAGGTGTHSELSARMIGLLSKDAAVFSMEI